MLVTLGVDITALVRVALGVAYCWTMTQVVSHFGLVGLRI